MPRSLDGILNSDQIDPRSSSERRLVVAERAQSFTPRAIVVPARNRAIPLPINDIQPQPITQPEPPQQAPPRLENIITTPPPTPPNAPSPKSRRRWNWKSVSLVGVAIAVLGVTGFLGYETWRTNVKAQEVFAQPIENQTANSASAEAREGTDETPIEPNQKDAYVVGPDMPRILSIPSLGVEARVLRMSLNSDGNIQAPASIWDTGWYDGSAKPGEKGNAFIDGHVSGPTEPAIFKDLKNIAVNTPITIERGDGTILTYHVRSVETAKLDDIDMKVVLASPSGMSESLTIMTCGGNYLGDYSYDSRVIVRAERIY